MKKVLFLAVFVVLGTTSLMAQDQDRVQDRDQDRLMMVDGEVLQIRDRDQIRLQDPIRLNDGTVVNPDGSYITKDRERLRLQDGECLDNDGVKYRNEYQYRYKIQQENKGLNDAQIQERNQNRFQVMMIDGEAFQVRNHEQTRLRNQVELGDGIVVYPNGNYRNAQQKELQLQEGECINMDGAIFRNMYQNRKMILQKNMKANKMIKKGTTIKRKTGKKTSE